MTASDLVLIRQCGYILLHDPNDDDIYIIAEALRFLAISTNHVAQCEAIDEEYQAMVDDAKRKGTF